MNAGPRAIVLGAAVAGALAGGVFGILAPADPDFLRLHAAGALVAEGGAARLYERPPPAAGPEGRASGIRAFRGTPATAVAAAPIGMLPERAAWILWEALCGAAAAAGTALAVTAAARAGGCIAKIAAAAAIPAAPLLLEAVARGNLAAPLLLLAAGSFAALGSGRDRTAGALAGAATALKVAPVLLVLWFAWKRRPKALACGLGATAVLSLLLPVFAAGPSGGTTLVRRWAALDDPLVTEIDERPGTAVTVPGANVEGQSVKAILYRLLGRTSWYRLRERGLEQGIAADPGRIDARVAGPLPSGTLYGIWLGCVFLILTTAVFATGPRERDDPASAEARLPLEGGLVLAAVPLVWPEAREIHFVLCIPALAAIAAALGAEARAGRPAGAGTPFPLRAALAAAGALLLLLPAGGLLGRDLSEAFLARGATGWGGLLVFTASALTLFHLRAATPGMGPAPQPVP